MTAIERRIKKELERIKNQNCSGDESEIVMWAIPGKLACSQRQLRYHQKFCGRNPLPPEARPLIVSWVKRIKQMGILSIICLLEYNQLDRHYVRGGLGLHENGLLGYYKSQGLEVHHFPMTDYQRPQEEDMQKVLKTFGELPKPVLLHCSAGFDRTAPVAAFIVQQTSSDLRPASGNF